MLLGIDHLNNDRQILRQPQQMSLVHDGTCTEARDTVKYRRTRKSFSSEEFEQCGVEWPSFPTVGLADEDTHQDLFA